jgi:hypothetical protein
MPIGVGAGERKRESGRLDMEGRRGGEGFGDGGEKEGSSMALRPQALN